MQPTCLATPILLLQRHYQHVLIESSASSSAANNLKFAHLQNLQVISSLVHALAKQAHALGGLNVEDKFFTPHGFISLATRTTSTLSWILGKSLLKPKRAHIHTKRRQNPWFKLMAHHLIFWLMIQAHESHRGNFGSRGLEGQKVCSVKL